jgi:hypothetical protein
LHPQYKKITIQILLKFLNSLFGSRLSPEVTLGAATDPTRSGVADLEQLTGAFLAAG